jgi:hypothetical protein
VRGILDLRSVKRVSLHAITPGLVRNLRGFAKGHEVPTRSNAASKKFIGRLAAGEIKSDLDAMFHSVREAFGFKRKELEASCEGNAGYLRTPQFEYRVQVEQDTVDPAGILWHREIAALRSLALIGSPEFRKAFGSIFDMLVLRFAKSIDVAGLIDQIESSEWQGVKVACPIDAAWCEIAIGGFRGAIRVEPHSVCIEGRRAPPLPSLFDQFLRFVQR